MLFTLQWKACFEIAKKILQFPLLSDTDKHIALFVI